MHTNQGERKPQRHKGDKDFYSDLCVLCVFVVFFLLLSYKLQSETTNIVDRKDRRN